MPCVQQYGIVYRSEQPAYRRAEEFVVDPQIASFQQLYHDGVLDGVALVAADSTACQACAEVADRVYLPSRLPPLPIAGCARESGCRCRYEPSFTVYE